MRSGPVLWQSKRAIKKCCRLCFTLKCSSLGISLNGKVFYPLGAVTFLVVLHISHDVPAPQQQDVGGFQVFVRHLVFDLEVIESREGLDEKFEDLIFCVVVILRADDRIQVTFSHGIDNEYLNSLRIVLSLALSEEIDVVLLRSKDSIL